MAEAGLWLLIGMVLASVVWAVYCRHLRDEIEREHGREAFRERIARRGLSLVAAGRPATPEPVKEAAEPQAGSSGGSVNPTPRRQPSRKLTVLVIEPDSGAQRRLVILLSERGHRVVPTASGEQAFLMAQRLRFDLVLSAAGLPGLGWVELYERIHKLTGGFVLVSEGYNGGLFPTYPGCEARVLRKPVEGGELDRLLAEVESQAVR